MKYPEFGKIDLGKTEKIDINTTKKIQEENNDKGGCFNPIDLFVDEIDLSSQTSNYTQGTVHTSMSSNDNPYLRSFTLNGEEYYAVDTAIPIEEYAAYIQKNRLYQDAGFQDGQCMVLSQYYAVDMLRGKFTSKRTMNAHEGAPACRINVRCSSSDPNVVLQYCFEEITKGHPVVLQVTQKNSYKGDRHLVTMVGFTKDVKSWEDLNPNNILVLDCADGKIQPLGLSREEGGHARDLFAQGGSFQALGPTDRFLKSIGCI